METYYGYVETSRDASILFEACRLGILPRVRQRISEKEKQTIRSGSVFVWDEGEAAIRRWTDGKIRSASRASEEFLTHHEKEGKPGKCFSTNRRHYDKTPGSGRGRDEDQHCRGYMCQSFKAGGLVKMSLSTTTSSGQRLHLISYYHLSQCGHPDFVQPTNDPAM
ncbi:hypothetical protein ACHAO7_011978 [Fusarium culmorum]